MFTDYFDNTLGSYYYESMVDFLKKNAIGVSSTSLLIFAVILLIGKENAIKVISSTLKPKISYVEELNSPEKVARLLESDGKYDESQTKAIWEGKPVALPPRDLSALVNKNRGAVLGIPGEEKWIEVDLEKQRLYAKEGNKIIYEFKISSGKPWTPTVTGEYRIYYKVRAQLMSGGEGSDYYYLPNVPFVQYFYKGYSFHGTYWHNDFGRPRSHGCVNLSIPDAETLFWWASPPLPAGKYTVYSDKDNPGTKVVVHGKTPPYN